MTDRELDALLCGAVGASLTLTGGITVYFTRHDLKTPQGWRAALRRALGHTGYQQPPVYDVEDHDRIVRTLFAFADAIEREAQDGVPGR